MRREGETEDGGGGREMREGGRGGREKKKEEEEEGREKGREIRGVVMNLTLRTIQHSSRLNPSAHAQSPKRGRDGGLCSGGFCGEGKKIWELVN